MSVCCKDEIIICESESDLEFFVSVCCKDVIIICESESDLEFFVSVCVL